MVTLVSLITPTNLSSEKSKFFSDPSYNPQFKYDLEESKVSRYLKRNPQNKRFIDAFLNQNLTDLVSKATNLYQTTISGDLLSECKSIVLNKPSNIPQKSLKDIKKSFEKALKFFDLNYSVLISNEEGFNFRPKHSQKQIVVGKDLDLQFFSVDGEVKHELVHIVRHRNGVSNKIRSSENYLPTEEGLATYIQDYFGENGNTSRFQHAAEYLATEVGLRGSLREIFNFFKSIGFNDELAWQRSIRHKFGFIDTSQPGDIIKPAMYFAHSKKVASLEKDEIIKLFVGKISIEDINRVKEYKGAVPVQKIQDFFTLR